MNLDKIEEMFLLASRVEVSCSLNFNAGCETFDVSISSPAPVENWCSKDYGNIECTLDSAIEYLKTLLP